MICLILSLPRCQASSSCSSLQPAVLLLEKSPCVSQPSSSFALLPFPSMPPTSHSLKTEPRAKQLLFSCLGKRPGATRTTWAPPCPLYSTTFLSSETLSFPLTRHQTLSSPADAPPFEPFLYSSQQILSASLYVKSSMLGSGKSEAHSLGSHSLHPGERGVSNAYCLG